MKYIKISYLDLLTIPKNYTFGRESYDKKLLDLCVYHSFEKNAILLNSEYLRYKNK